MEKVGKGQPKKLIAIGTSAGGLEPLQVIMSTLPTSLGSASIVVAQHLSPHYKSMMRELLGRKTNLVVEEIVDNMPIEENKIYTIPPDNDLLVEKNKFRLMKPSSTGPKPSINRLFKSLAKSYKSKAIGIILSGTGSDGSEGIVEIKNAGGITIAQDPQSAKYPGMPIAAIGTGKVNYELPPEEIGNSFIKLIGRVRNLNESVDISDNEAQIEETVSRVLSLLEEKVGTNFNNYKTSTIYRRLEKRLQDKNFANVDKYLSYVQNNREELDKLFQYLLIGVTEFFRNPDAYKALEPYLEDALLKSVNKKFRVWVPGCASGEEAYTIAILIFEIISKHNLHDFQIQVFATDIDQNALNKARSGIYNTSALENVPENLKKNYFHKKGHQYEVIKNIRQLVLFTRHDLTSNPPFLKIDLLSCRNLLIYFNASLQNHVIPIFNYALKANGLLFLGRSESVGPFNKLFTPLDPKNKIFRSKESDKLHINFPSLKPIMPRKVNPVRKEPVRKSFSLHEMIKETLFSTYEHPFVIVDSNLEMVEIFGDVSPFIKIKSGIANVNILKLLNQEHQLEFRAVIGKAVNNSEISKGGLRKIQVDNKEYYLRFIVKPLKHSIPSNSLFMIVFELIDADEKMFETREVVYEDEESSRFISMEHELNSTREYMNNLVQELETSNEELQALNEELQSSNEELQASNEELETSNEELQASNEELEIAYSELRSAHEEIEAKAQKLRLSENKLKTLFENVLQGFVMIDNNYNIDTFNPTARKFFKQFYKNHLNIGKSYIELVPENHVEVFLTEIRAAFEGKTTFQEQEMKNKNGISKFIQMTFTPVKDKKNIDKVLISFIDITNQKVAEQALKKSYEDLEQQKEQWQTLTLLSPDLIAIVSGDEFRIKFANPAYKNIFTGIDIVGKTVEDLFKGLAKSDIVNDLKKVKDKGKKIILYEYPLKINKKTRYYNITYSPLKKTDQMHDIIIYATDVTPHVSNRQEIEKAHKQTAVEKEKFENLLLNAPALIAIHKGPDHIYDYANQLYKDIFNHKDLVGKKYKDVAISSSAKNFKLLLDEVYNAGKTIMDHEIPGFTEINNGKTQYFNFILQPWYDIERRIVGVITFAYEVTEQVTTRHTIEANVAFINTLNESMPQKVWTAKSSGTFDYLNKLMREYFGIDKNNNDYKEIAWKIFTHPDDHSETIEKWTKSLNDGADFIVQHRLKDASNNYKWHLTRGLPLKNESGKIIQWIGTSTDIDEQKQSEQLKDEFLSIASHELKTPLTTIQAYIDLLYDKISYLGDEEIKLYIDKTLVSLKKLNLLVSELLDISRIESGKLTFEKTIVDFDEMVKESVDNVRYSTKSHEIVINGRTLKKVKGDNQRLEQVLVNLLSNAIKYSPDHNKIEVNISSDDHHVYCEVVDGGIGIPAKHLKNIFERYYRANEKHRYISGLGIGLFITKQIVNIHGGEIGVESKEGEGSTFYFSLPVYKKK